MRSSIPTFRLYGESRNETAGLWLHCETIPERSRLHGWEIRPHRHETFFQVLHISSGSGEALVNGRYRPFEHSTAIFVPPGEVHGFRFSRDIEGFVLTALSDRLTAPMRSSTAITAFADKARLIRLASDTAPARDVVDTIARIHAELDGHGAGRMVLLEALVAGLIVALMRADGPALAREHPNERDASRIAALYDLVAAHFRERRPVSFYAAELGLSDAHLNRICRAGTGGSVQALVNARLVEAATRDLIFTPTPVQGIAYSLGFSDPAYFNRFFRKQTGRTPGALRASERPALAAT
ncbi:helix-turn-helix domain-containing protein [Mesorhizobium sp. L-8-3]|uniref:helix-turn-helix domain-containing protein n=1 Tax=Mesorhizobium sp. L-8-3 TaxID=2744522 RepID=UPI0019294834|nr:helix-turn-helix domain-containing protein [Mesorhizobium sp. L-8-3]BCH24048.1 AraC family transcriptional regulator [Mesorhizobium sp. L-8-3]